MITKITSDNDLEFYAPRFQQITEALAMETEETRDKMIQAVSAKINLYAPITDSTMAKANTYLQEVISNKKARSANRDILIDAYESALIEHSFNSLMALQQADIKAELKTEEEAEAWAQENCIPDNIIADLRTHIEEFADAAIEAYTTYGLVIDSLETYFSNLNDIKNLTTSQLERGKFLLVMPADEPYFEIDANARTISVPADFKKYGVGVYGDHYAELLTFKIDRYFDNQDFMNTKIAINWNFTPTGSRVPAFEETQAQMAFAKDDELEPGYVVFGFFVTKEMTPSKGILSFSITCYNEANNEITYSFNTQVAQVNINDGFTLLNPSEVKNVGDDFLNRISSSAYTPEGVSPIEDPVWELGALDSEGNPLGLENELNFNIDENGVEDEVLAITTQAYAPGINTMKYTWFITPTEGNAEPDPDGEIIRLPDTVTKPSDYFRTRDVSPQENSVYYIKENGAINPKPLPHQDLTVEEAFANNMELYELGSTYEATGAGKYYVEAQASKTTVRSNGTYIKTVSNIIESNNCIIPSAVKPAVTIEVTSALTPENTDFVLEDEETPYKFISASAAPVINAVVTSTTDQPLGAIALEAVNVDDIAELNVETIVANTKSEENPTGKYDFSLLPASGEKQVNAEGLIAEGKYQIRAINRRNHTYSVSEPSEIVQTSFIAPKITELTVKTLDGSTWVTMLDNGQLPADAPTEMPYGYGKAIELNRNYLSRTFILDDNTPEEFKYETAVTTYIVEEVEYDDQTQDWKISYAETAPEPDEIDVVFDEEYVDADHPAGALKFEISGDNGIYRIRTENRYNGTLRIGYTDVFRVTVL